jgi:hypothetical protein
MSAQGIPQIAVVMGSCTAGGAYVPAMSDESIIVREQGTIFLAGPPLVKAATGEIVSAEELGGADVHTRVSGVADHFALNDQHALAIARRIVDHLNRVKHAALDLAAPREPLSRSSSSGVINARRRKPHDVRGDRAAGRRGESLCPLSVTATLVTGFARLWGYRWASSRILGRRRGNALHRAASQRGIPLVFPQNTSGSWSGQSTRPAARQGRRQAGHRRVLRPGPQVHGDHRRQLRGGQLRHVRPRVQPALPVDVAQCAHLGDGRRAGCHRACHDSPRCDRGEARHLEQR